MVAWLVHACTLAALCGSRLCSCQAPHRSDCSDTTCGRPRHASCSGVSHTVAGGRLLLDLTGDPACSTNRALGYALGKQHRDNIVARLAAAGPQLQKAMEYASSAAGRAARDSLVSATQAHYPQYWEELEGIAEGAQLQIDLVVALNLRQELSILAEGGRGTRGADDCSDSMVKRNGVALLGHNEDNTADNVNTTYFVQARLNGRAWTAYTYAGELASAAWGFNDAGVSFTLNAVYAREVRAAGLARNFVSRSLLDAASLEDAVLRLTVGGQATGHNVQLAGLDGRRILTVETGPGTQSDVKEIAADESYFHANAFLRLDVPQAPGPSSEHRQRRAAELPAPRSRAGVLRILGDTRDARYPIWRSGTDGEFTLCTALWDLYQETVEVIFSNPSEDLAAARSWVLPLRSPAAA